MDGTNQGRFTRGVKSFPENNQRVRYLTLEERLILHENAAPHLDLMMLLAENAGLRLSEILYLKQEKTPWKEYAQDLPDKDYEDLPDSYIDWQTRTVVVENPKNRKTKRVPMNRTLTERLESLRVHADSPFLFCHDDGRPYNSIKTAFNKAVKRAGIKDLRFHDLRHDFASQLTMKGVGQFAVMELMGHSSTAMTKRYAHLSPEHNRHAVELLDE